MRNFITIAILGLLAAGCEGPEGPAGADGANGTNGTDGLDGADGADGEDGEDGTDGADGTDGTDGTNGSTGPSGSDGTDGTDGTDGADGTDGENAGDFMFSTTAFADYDQVDRMGMPAINTAVIASKDAYNQASTAANTDLTSPFVGEIIASLDFLHDGLDDDLASLNLTPCAQPSSLPDGPSCVTQAAPLVIPDVIRINYLSTSGFPNGRRITDASVDITLSVVLLDADAHGISVFDSIDLSQPGDDVFHLSAFPYLGY